MDEQDNMSPDQSPMDALYRAIRQSQTLRGIYRDVYGVECPDIDHQTSFITRSELSLLAQELSIGEGDRLLDLGCGAGGPGLWVAKQTGASVTGVDTSPVAVEVARHAAVERGMGPHAQYLVADMANTGLPARSFAGAVSIDALQVLPDPRKGLEEALRLLRPGARLAFTTWQTRAPQSVPEARRARFVEDYRTVLEGYGLNVLHHIVPAGWRAQQLAIADGVLRQQAVLRAELGDTACALLVEEAQQEAEWLGATDAKRVLVVAEAPQGADVSVDGLRKRS